MRNPLPFEGDSPELLAAVAAALAALTPVQAREQTALPRRPEAVQTYAARALESVGDAAAQSAYAALPEYGLPFLRTDAGPAAAPVSAEAISREIERDARRFEAN